MQATHLLDRANVTQPYPDVTVLTWCFRLQHETDAKEHHLQRCNDLDARVNKLSSRNDSLVDELRQQDAEAATANGNHTTVVMYYMYEIVAFTVQAYVPSEQKQQPGG